ncbi:hypothetical protein ABEB36_002271 [Hypothenemus hampei]|uniref:Uncharacterized protein n=1 Tax=Hypothenemus hampei TaxID=57062 RepID=A0ABD1F546_HYPHA
MRSIENNSGTLTANSRVQSLSIIIDDFDSAKDQKSSNSGTSPRVYTRSYSDASIKKFLEEAEHRKHEFWKLLDEHNAVIENLKRIEKLEHKII